MADQQSDVAPVKFGTFLGVYTPSVLTILGLIMYLRFGWVVGNAGLPATLVIVVLSSAITFITALSASAIATNMRVGVGGEYYMIAHSLGLEFGGAIGIPLYFCRTLSITFYSYGLSESVLHLLKPHWASMPDSAVQILAAIIIVIITLISSRSTNLALKMQVPILLVVGLSVFALAAGVLRQPISEPPLSGSYPTAPGGFWEVFAVFFPAVTGFAVGIGMSGDLKDPSKSIPRGSILAVLTGLAVYLLIPILLGIAGTMSQDQLAHSGVESWTTLALFGGILVFPGIWGAILSSAIGSVLGGPRVLQALAMDSVAPRFLSRVTPTGEPRIATWISGAIALTAVTIGELNTIARLVTILFLTLYVMINFSAGIERLVSDISYRPRIRVPWWLSMGGALGTIAVMFLIDPLACIAAVVIEIGLYMYMRRKALRQRWGDVRAGFWASLARWSLLNLRERSGAARNWRPNILVFSGDTSKRMNLIRLAAQFNQNLGILTACHLLEGNIIEEAGRVRETSQIMDRDLEQAGIPAFSEVGIVDDFERGAVEIAQANGIAGLRSNTVMFGWPKSTDRLATQLRIMRTMSGLEISTIIARLQPIHRLGKHRRIDIWWRGKQRNGDLMLLLAYLLTLNDEWLGAEILIRSVVADQNEYQEIDQNLKTLLPEVRINAHCELIVRDPAKDVFQMIHESSTDADAVFMGLMVPGKDQEQEYAWRITELVRGLKNVVLVHNASEFAGHLI